MGDFVGTNDFLSITSTRIYLHEHQTNQNFKSPSLIARVLGGVAITK